MLSKFSYDTILTQCQSKEVLVFRIVRHFDVRMTLICNEVGLETQVSLWINFLLIMSYRMEVMQFFLNKSISEYYLVKVGKIQTVRDY